VTKRRTGFTLWFASDWFGVCGGRDVSIVRVGLGETKNYSAGYDAIFSKKKSKPAKKAKAPVKAKNKKAGKKS
jgi:hypothetical protein